MRKLIVAASVAAVMVPFAATAQAKGPGKMSARQACVAERTADSAAFQAKYANAEGKKAFKRCVSRHVKQARKTCRAERKAGKAAFRAKYANARGKHAFDRCVRAHSGDPVS
jgi:hypothetical protein